MFGVSLMASMSVFALMLQAVLSGHEFLDAAKQVALAWSTDADSITFEISAPTKGYLALGISPDGSMLDADMVIGWVIDGKATLSDRFANEYKEPIIDSQQDYHLLSGTNTGTHTSLKFKRKLVTGDVKDRDIKAGSMNLIYAYHDVAPTDGHTIEYHGTITRGTKSVVLIK